MSNTEPVAPVTAPAATAPATEPAAAPSTPQDYEKLYRDEVAARINERNLYKPAQQMLNNLDEGSRAALLELAELARAGDPEAITEWNLRTISQVNDGKDAAAIIAERQARAGMTGAAPVADAPKYLTAAEAEAIADQRIAARDQATASQAAVRAEMAAKGYKLESAVGETIIRYAVQTNSDLPTAIAWYENDAATSAMERARAAAAAGASIPGVAPTGTPAGATPDSKPDGMSDSDFRRSNILSRLAAGPAN